MKIVSAIICLTVLTVKLAMCQVPLSSALWQAPVANPYSASWIYYTTDSISGLSFLGGISSSSLNSALASQTNDTIARVATTLQNTNPPLIVLNGSLVHSWGATNQGSQHTSIFVLGGSSQMQNVYNNSGGLDALTIFPNQNQNEYFNFDRYGNIMIFTTNGLGLTINAADGSLGGNSSALTNASTAIPANTNSVVSAAQAAAVAQNVNAASGIYGFTNAQTIWVDPNGTSSGIRGNDKKPFALLSQAVAVAQPGDTIYINPGKYFEAIVQIVLTNNCYIYAANSFYTISNGNTSTAVDIQLNDNDTISGGTFTHISTSPGGVNGVIGAASIYALHFTNCTLNRVTIVSDAGCFKFSTIYSGVCDIHFYDCRFYGTTTAFTSEGSSATLVNYIYNCEATLTNTINPGNNRSALKIRGGAGGIYYINNCKVVINDAGLTSFASGISSGHVPSGAGGDLAAGSFICNGLVIDTTQCTNAQSEDINVHALAGAIVLNSTCTRPDGSFLSWSNYNGGVNPFTYSSGVFSKIYGDGSGLNKYLTNNFVTGENATTTVATYTTPSGVTNTYAAGGWVNVTAVATDTVQLQVLYTDYRGASQTANLMTTAVGTAISTPGTTIQIQPAPNTTVTEQATVVGGVSITFDADMNLSGL